ncbi:high-affinity branched-chain amino acid ABC transporter ATP-binding protein LivG [Geothermobacter hydrogeniphilus]|uniref:High-affinity branched-chain amino acid ABC transporter ATP-binding protein LivG n=1 Tax=Geothermobacter hydrogeniphilus TaxID=1969733 RepID=A0A2K2H964_9BACT|nr:ABC transporter ATP-binding protein [Geothermobacter hydrogeniphilus]PNU19817.1 high-affinity branched-chain amino acid ABC transporter ATP-binding protein LivG [Geothermobacter hydrogeniphilus]
MTQTQTHTNTAPVLEVRGLTQRFGGLTAVNNFNVTLKHGELAGLIGPNGAGKTTVFNLVSGFYQPSEGDILVCGSNTKGMKPHQVTGLGVARTFQNIRLWNDMSVLDNIRVAQHGRLGYGFFHAIARSGRYRRREDEVEREARELLEVFDLLRFADEYPKNLPYGTQRKLEIARALSSHPQLLLLDEPAAGLNSADVKDLIRLVRWIHGRFDVTIWMIEHHMDVMMELCEQIKVIDFGQTIAEGTPETVRNHPAVITAYLGDDNI